MKELFQKMMKKLRKHSEAAGAIAALLLIVLFSGVMILGIRTQRESVPENPIDGMEKSSMVMLTGTKEVLAEQTKENGSSRQQMQNQQSENQDMPETESESSKESGADSQGTESTGSGSKTKTAVQQRQTEMLPETIPAIAAGLHQEQTEAITETEQAAKRRMETIKTTKSRIRITPEIKTKTKTAKKTGSISGQRLKTAGRSQKQITVIRLNS